MPTSALHSRRTVTLYIGNVSNLYFHYSRKFRKSQFLFPFFLGFRVRLFDKRRALCYSILKVVHGQGKAPAGKERT